MSDPAAPRIVLVHGAFNGAWCFDRLVDRLRARGRDAVAVDLPGHGADAGPFGDLHVDAARVTSVLDDVDPTSGAILVGHSYGGAVITEAGIHPSVRRLVYLAAFALDADETCGNAANPAFKAAGYSHAGRPNLGHAFVPDEAGNATLDPAQVPVLFYGDCDQATIDWAMPQLGAHPLANLRQEPAAVAWRTKPSTYAISTDDMAVHPGLQHIMANRCTDQVEWPTAHFSFLSHPDLVADLLDGL
jgi:pimeloyl-ACP methyl ester carboxylesterase